MKTNYTLKATELKNGKILYTVIDSDGNILAQRTSIRKYIACTIDGDYFFGRYDLIGKGDHGRRLASIDKHKNTSREAYDAELEAARRDIFATNRIHLKTWMKYHTLEQYNEPVKDWQIEHLREFYGEEVANSVRTQLEFQVASTNSNADFERHIKMVGSYEEWKADRIEYVSKMEKRAQVAYLAE